ncbi:MAG TPA: twin-arginine translocase TatA/TatE family subunit [Alphaproteobacteria bacterium]
MGIGFGELMVILVVVLILFGAGKLPGVMSELGKGVKNFKSGMKDENASSASSDKKDSSSL